MAGMPTEQDVRQWAVELEHVGQRIAVYFARSEVRARATAYLRGLAAGVQRKNGWQLAEFCGELSPKNVQHFVGRAKWDADEVRDDLRNYVSEHLGRQDGVLIVDETGFLKKGTKSAGVARQYSGTAGRIENSQIGVFLAYRSKHGHALIDRELYLPKVWTDDRERCREAGIPANVAFATKPELARQMLRRAFRAGVLAAWVTADEVYGGDSKFRKTLEKQGIGYVVAVSSQQRLFLGGRYARVDEHVAAWPPEVWRKLSCGCGTKGKRIYEWAFLGFGEPTEKDFHKGLLVRRSLKDPNDHAYYLTCANEGVSLTSLVCVAGARWAVEECFEQAKQETGLDGYEVRSWHAWHRHITLSMFAHAMLAVIRSKANARQKKGLVP